MKLRALELDQFRKFDRPVRIGGLADGLNLIVGPNEMGKSTLLAALVAALFERHRSNAKLVQSFQPHRHRTAPQVALDFEIGSERYRIEKQFLKRPHAHLHLPDGARVDGDDAEAMLEKLLAFDPGDRRAGDDIWSVLWVAQGRSFDLPEVGATARVTLQDCLDAELGQAVGVDQGPDLQRGIEDALLELVDRRGKPRARYQALEHELAELDREIDGDQQRAEELEQELARLEDQQRLHDQLSREQATQEDPKALAAARKQRDGLVTLAARQREAQAAEALARQASEQADQRIAERAKLVAALAAADAQQGQAADAEAEAAKQMAAHAAALAWQQDEVVRIEALRGQQEARFGGVRNLRRWMRQADDSRAAIEARATEVALSLEPDALVRVQVDGQPAVGGKQKLQALDPIEITIEGVGQIAIRPRIAHAKRWRRDLADALHQIDVLLEELELIRRQDPDPPPGQLSLFGQRAGARPDLAAIEGLAAETERRIEALGAELEAARGALDQQTAGQRRLEIDAARGKARLEQARDGQAQLRRQLAAAEEQAPQADLDEAANAARKTLEQASEALARLADGDPGAVLAEVETRIGRLEEAIEQRRNRLGDLRAEIEGLQARVRLHAGEGFAERLERARRRRDEARHEHAKCQREVAVLSLLRKTLAEAERDAKERYLAPVAERIRPYLQALFPDAEIVLDEALRITSLRRDAGEEAFEQLSEGTREQIAILVRLALAELLCDQGKPAVVVLDDALVFSDDERMQRMFAILERAAQRLQIVVLTCRERLFEGVAGKRLHLERPEPAAARGAA